MEGSVPCYKLGSQELSSNSESGTIPYSSGDISMNDLKMCLNEISVEDVESPASGLLAESNSKCGLVMEYDCKVSDEPSASLLESTSSVEGLLPGEKGRDGHKTSEANACDKSVDQCYPPPNSSAVSFYCNLSAILISFCNSSNISCEIGSLFYQLNIIC